MITKVAPKTDEDRILIGQFIRALAGIGKYPKAKYAGRMNSVIISEIFRAQAEHNSKREQDLRELLKNVAKVYSL